MNLKTNKNNKTIKKKWWVEEWKNPVSVNRRDGRE